MWCVEKINENVLMWFVRIKRMKNSRLDKFVHSGEGIKSPFSGRPKESGWVSKSVCEGKSLDLAKMRRIVNSKGKMKWFYEGS